MEHRLALQLKRISEVLGKRINARARAHGLTYTQCRVLSYLYGNTGKKVTQRDIEELLGVTHASVSVLIQCMKMRGLITVTTDPTDHRAKNIGLKDGKKNILDVANNEATDIEKVMVSGFSGEELNELSGYLDRIYENITAIDGIEHTGNEGGQDNA